MMDLVEEAILYATVMHQGKVRKRKNIPVILHSLEVAQILGTLTEDREIIAAGILHDIVEDTSGTPDEIRHRFGDRVALMVDSEARKQVEKAAVSFVTKEYQRLGYKVTSREKENIGWDLDAEKGGVRLKLEVKGLAQSQISIHISSNEYNSMKAYKDSYRLCVVTKAVSNPTLVKFIWDEDLNAWVSDLDESIVLTIDMKPSYLAVVE